MGTSKSHGFAGYVEPPRPDDPMPGVVAETQADAGQERRPDGTLVKGARTVPSMGGKATKNTTKLSHRITLDKLPEVWAKRARALRRAACAELARDVGGGVCGVVGSSMVKFAAEAMALAEHALEQGDYEQHRKLAESARMHLVYAREHCGKVAAARAKDGGAVPPALAAFLEDGRS